MREFYKKLFESADELRKNIDAAEYKHVVLGIVFLKFVSDKFNIIFLELKKDKLTDPEDPDEYLAKNVFYLPRKSRWDYIVENARQPNIGNIIDDALKKIEENKGIISGGLAVNENLLGLTTGSGQIFAINKDNGEIIWSNKINAIIRSAPIISGNFFLVLGKDNRLYAFNLSSGELSWTHEGLDEVSTFLGSSSPVVSKGIVIVTYSSGEIYAINLSNGAVIWNDNLSTLVQKRSIESISDIRGNAVIQNDTVYVISHNGRMVAMNLNSGKRLWESNIGGIQTPWVVSNFIYVLSKDNELICMTAKEGKIVWVSKLRDYISFEKKGKLITWSGPLLAGHMLIVSGSHGIIASISPYTGKFLGAINVKSSVQNQAIVSNKTVFFLTSKGDLLAYR